MSVIKLILVSGNLPIVATAILAAIHYRRLPYPIKIFSLFIFFSGIIQGVSFALWYYRQNNLLLSHVYVAVGFLGLAWFYVTVLGNFVKPVIIWSVAIAFVIFTIVNAWAWQKITIFNSNALTVECILVLILSLSTYLLLLNERVREANLPVVSSLGWINSGLFIYYASSLLLFYFGRFIMHRVPISWGQQVWVLHTLFNDVMYICFFIGLWKRPRN